GGTLFFFAGSAYEQRWDLWKSNGTGEGTTRVQVLSLGPDDYQSGPVKMTPVGGQVFFRTGKGGSLWRSDGTQEGTLIVKHSSDVRELKDFRGSLFFTAWDQASGYELWKSDGTTAGTVLVADLKPGGDSAAPFWLTVVDDQLLFSAETEEHGRELWRSDGTQEGTALLHDLVPGEESAAPALLTIVGPRVFFLATDGANGVEPWVLNDCVPPTLTCPADLTVEATSPNGAVTAWSPPQVSDNKPAQPLLSFSHPSGDTFPLGTTPVTITATDESGNSSQCGLSITVRDTQPPRLVCPTDQMIERTTRHGAVVHYQPATVRDEVSTPQVKYAIPSGSEFPLGSTPVRVLATDAAGNRALCTFQVTVMDAVRQGACGCGTTTPGGLIGWALLVTLSRFAAWRRRK
ncbi:MAG TPA: ELWxxDGT repeat protein, partial [Myxococcaceae bacterium]|nr:ELWxxDGT repeat protein [Myxococcaceae bacterium]